MISCGGDQLGGGGGGKGQVNGGETHIVLCLALNMWTEQDTEICSGPGGGSRLGSSLDWEGGYVRRQLFGC